MKARIKQNAWGNWYGYLGTRRVIAFSNSIPGFGMESEANDWLKTLKSSLSGQLQKSVRITWDDSHPTSLVSPSTQLKELEVV